MKNYLIFCDDDKFRKEVSLNLALRIISDIKRATTVLDENMMKDILETNKDRTDFISKIIEFRNKDNRADVDAIISLKEQEGDRKQIKDSLDITNIFELSPKEENIRNHVIKIFRKIKNDINE
jgi:hypothetical protein